MGLSESYRDAFLALLPPGNAFPRDLDTVLAKLAEALTAESVRIHERGLDLLEEADPRTCVELFEEWCASYGVGADGTQAERRAQLVARASEYGGQSIPYLIEVAGKLGYAITIAEYRPTRCGGECGDSETDTADQIFVMTVAAAEFTEFPAEVGEALCGDASCGGTVTNALLERELGRVKPSHTHLVFSYGG